MATEGKGTATRARTYVLDVAVVLLALLLAVCLWQKNNIAYFFEADTAQKSYTVTFAVDGVRYDTTKTLVAGSKMYVETDNGQVELGSLLDAPEVLPYFTSATTEGGEVAVLMPGTDAERLVNLNGTFTCRGLVRGDTLVLHSYSLTVGTVVAVQTEYNNFLLRVVSITENV